MHFVHHISEDAGAYPSRSYVSYAGLSALPRFRRLRNWRPCGLWVLGPVLALVTYLVLAPIETGRQYAKPAHHSADYLVYILLVARLFVASRAVDRRHARAKFPQDRGATPRLTACSPLMAVIPDGQTGRGFCGVDNQCRARGVVLGFGFASCVGNSLAAAEAIRRNEQKR